MRGDKNLWVLVLICVINSLGFGLIFPLLYQYGKEFGLTKQTLGLLMASFSIAQFFATPMLGALSDKFGRKPILVISLAGTFISFILFAEARCLLMLFASRILDGLTGGNISVAQAMVSDSSTSENRAKNFGILGSAFAFGVVIGPAIGGLLSKFGLQVPFFFAAGVSLAGVLCSIAFLNETNNVEKKNIATPNYLRIFTSLVTIHQRPVLGTAIVTGFLLTMAQLCMSIGFQVFSIDVLKVNTVTLGWFFAAFGIVGICAQLGVPFVTRVFKSKSRILLISTLFCLVAMFLTGFANGFLIFAMCLTVYGLFNGLRNPMLNAIIAENNSKSEQGKVMGINQSYASLGQILGPISAGLIGGWSVHAIFFLSAGYILIALLFSIRLRQKQQS
ncbi:MAG: MFS transporter [Sphingobacteriales bacterium]